MEHNEGGKSIRIFKDEYSVMIEPLKVHWSLDLKRILQREQHATS